jgi:ferredoxin hydrogenase small subunit
MAEPLNVLWLQSGGCGGCSMSLLCADTGDFAAQLRQLGIHLLWHPSLSLESGRGPCRCWRTAWRAAPLDVLCVEGAMLRGPGGTGRFHLLAGTQQPMMDWVRRLSAVAHHVVAVGSCAAYGGISAGGSNPTDACGLQYEGDQCGGLLGAAGAIRRACRWSMWPAAPPTPAGCSTPWRRWPRSPAAEELDSLGRPRAYCDQLVHHGCTRNEFYEYKASAEKPSTWAA